MKSSIKLWHAVLFLVVAAFLYFYHITTSGLLPIPSDALIGLFHPFRDLYAPDFPNGIPYRNFLLTDPIRQIIPWKELSVTLLSNLQLPLWNPYEMTGKPLLGNFQSSPFYPLNIFLFLKPFEYGWTVFIISQQVLAAFFMYLFVRAQKLQCWIAIFAGFTFAFSGFMIAWLEWGTLGHTILWLPLALYSTDKITQSKKIDKYAALFVISLCFALLAGHLQTFIYVLSITSAYFLLRIFALKRKERKRKLFLYLILSTFFAVLTSIQWAPTLQFVLRSARDLDQGMHLPGWFIPPQHLIQFFAPDFFGNPATLNYWGIFNYAEFFGYIGIVPLLAALLTIGLKKRSVLFFQIVCVVSLLIAVQNPVSQYLYSLGIPYLSSTQPTRLIGPISFSLIILSAYGLQELISKKLIKKAFIVLSASLILIFILYLTVFLNLFDLSVDELSVSRRNLILPSVVFAIAAAGFIALQLFHKFSFIKNGLILLLIGATLFEVTRSAQKFTPFSPEQYFYPSTTAIEFLQKDPDIFRVATLDDRAMPPNILTFYRLQSVDGYDPLYLNTFAQYISLNERQTPDISPPYGFNRIITPKNFDTQLFDFMNVKYVVTLSDLQNDKLTLLFEEGQTKIYRNEEAFPRVFFVQNVVGHNTEDDVAEALLKNDLRQSAFTTEKLETKNYATGSATIQKYSENEIIVSTTTQEEGFLVLSDAYYPTWHAQINGEESTIYKVNLNFRGIKVPPGENEIVFYTTLF